MSDDLQSCTRSIQKVIPAVCPVKRPRMRDDDEDTEDRGMGKTRLVEEVTESPTTHGPTDNIVKGQNTRASQDDFEIACSDCITAIQSTLYCNLKGYVLRFESLCQLHGDPSMCSVHNELYTRP